MIEIVSSEVDARLAKAKELVERGKQRRAIQELWYAEARARGNAEALGELLDFTRGLEQRVGAKERSRLVELVTALEHDAEVASHPPVYPAAPSAGVEPTGRFRVGLFILVALLSAGAGLLSFGIWVLNTGCDFFSTPVGGYATHTGPTAVAALAGIGLWLTSVLLASRHLDELHYLLFSILGFVLPYIAVLVAIVAVAKAIWGPAQCQSGGFGF